MKKKSIFWGIIFILLAAYVIINRLDIIPKLPVFTILLSLLLIYIIWMGIRKRNFAEILVPIALLGWQYDDFLGITELTPWTLLLAALLLAIGLEMIFKSTKLKRLPYKGGTLAESTERGTEGSVVNIESSFSGNNKYIACTDFSCANIENSFGQCNVYFENAIMANNHCVVNVSNSFGETNLYFPRAWRMNVERDYSFGKITMHGFGSTDMAAPFVQVNAETAFGTINIYSN